MYFPEGRLWSLPAGESGRGGWGNTLSRDWVAKVDFESPELFARGRISLLG